MGLILIVVFCIFGAISLGGAYFAYEIGTTRPYASRWIDGCRIALASIFGVGSTIAAAYATSFVAEDGRVQMTAALMILAGIVAAVYLHKTKPPLPPAHAFTSEKQ